MTLKTAFLSFLLLVLWVCSAYAGNGLIVGGSGNDLETFRQLAEAFKRHRPDSKIKVLPSIGSGGAIRGVRSDRIDIGLISRPLRENEIMSDIEAVHYADTALVYIVPLGNELRNVDTQLLKAIYRGGPEANGLIPILRPKSDSDTLILIKDFPEIRAALQAVFQRKGIPITMTDQDTLDLLQSNVNNIATSTLALVVSEQRPVRVLSLNGVEPDRVNIASGHFPLKKQCILIYRKTASMLATQFIDFVLSEEGSMILEQTGHVPP